MSNPFSIFYSWQSDLPSSDNKSLISKALDSASKELSKKLKSDINYKLVIDRDTKGTSGSPNIASTIFDKIRKADIFLCDVTPINNQSSSTPPRLIPNPNVLIELGFAINALGWDRIIFVNNLKYGKVEELPFDIRGHRITTYNSDLTDCQKHLSDTFKVALKSIVDNYDDILSRHNDTTFLKHDKTIYELLNSVCSEATLNESLTSTINNLYATRYDYDLWTNVRDFYKTTMNHFLDPDISRLFLVFVDKINNFYSKCATKFFYDDNNISFEDFQSENTKSFQTSELKKEHSKVVRFAPNREPFTNEDWWEADARIDRLGEDLYTLGEEVIQSYQNFIHEIKLKLFI